MHRKLRPVGQARISPFAAALCDVYVFPWQDLARRDEFRGRADGGRR